MRCPFPASDSSSAIHHHAPGWAPAAAYDQWYSAAGRGDQSWVPPLQHARCIVGVEEKNVRTFYGMAAAEVLWAALSTVPAGVHGLASANSKMPRDKNQRTLIRKSSGFFPLRTNAAIQRGMSPLPDQVSALF